MFHHFRSNSISRREFLQLGKIGLIAAYNLAILPKDLIWGSFTQEQSKQLITEFDYFPKKFEALSPNQQGRVLSYYIDVFDKPTFAGTKVNRYWHDKVLPITNITIGSSEDSFNLVWYEVGKEGFVHSSDIQPVFTNMNIGVLEIPKGGTLAEVTVPYTDAHWDAGEDKPVVYRFYYATTHWVTEIVNDEMGNPWYAVKDDKWDYIYYVPAAHLRLIAAEEVNPIALDVPPEAKRIEVHLTEQVMIAYEYDKPVFTARVATGAIFSNGDYSTPPGKYNTFHKRFSRHMARGNLAANGYDLPGVPWNSYITEEGIAFHGTYWHNNFGRPRSHGCINLTPSAAKWLFLWTTPTLSPDQEWVYDEDIGTKVDIIE